MKHFHADFADPVDVRPGGEHRRARRRRGLPRHPDGRREPAVRREAGALTRRRRRAPTESAARPGRLTRSRRPLSLFNVRDPHRSRRALALLLAAPLALAACSRPAGGSSSPGAPAARPGLGRRGARLGRRGRRRGERRADPRFRARAEARRATRAAAAGGVRDPPAGARGADRGAPARRRSLEAQDHPRGAPAPGGGREDRRAPGRPGRDDLRAEQGPLRRPDPRGRARAHPRGRRPAREGGAAGGLREGAARRGAGGGPARGPPGRHPDPRRRALDRPGRRHGDDRGVHRLPVPVLPPRPGRHRRGPRALRGQGALRAPRFPARRAPGGDARGARRPLRRGAGQVLGVPPEPDDGARDPRRGRPQGPRGRPAAGRGCLRDVPVVGPSRRRHPGVASGRERSRASRALRPTSSTAGCSPAPGRSRRSPS